MTKAAKLLEKLKNGSVNALELRTLLKQKDWVIHRIKGSHEVWAKGAETFILATHSKDLKNYQIKEIGRAHV